jgi:hypothetical protein
LRASGGIRPKPSENPCSNKLATNNTSRWVAHTSMGLNAVGCLTHIEWKHESGITLVVMRP